MNFALPFLIEPGELSSHGEESQLPLKKTSKNEAQSEHGCERQGLSALT